MLILTRFHCIYWPAFLMALDIPLPYQILTHAHWTLGREKMSKSTGNVVNPFFALDRFGVDTMRFFLALRGGIKDDASYDNDFISEIYKSSLQGVLGNLVSRLVRAKGWNIRRAVQSHQKAEDSDSQLHWGLLENLPMIALKQVEENLDSGAALDAIMGVVRKVCSCFNYNSSMNTCGTLTYLFRQTNICRTLRHGIFLMVQQNNKTSSTASSISAQSLFVSAGSYCNHICRRR